MSLKDSRELMEIYRIFLTRPRLLPGMGTRYDNGMSMYWHHRGWAQTYARLAGDAMAAGSVKNASHFAIMAMRSARDAIAAEKYAGAGDTKRDMLRIAKFARQYAQSARQTQEARAS